MNSSDDERTVTRPGVSLDEPHFDEEATLLAAQPVVPLVEVRAKTRSKARMALALAIGGGLLVGLLAATFVYRYAGTNGTRVVETSTAVSEQPNTDGSQSPSGGVAGEGTENSVIAAERETSPIGKPNATESSADVSPGPASRVAPKSRPVIVAAPEREEDPVLDREMRRAERQAEKRERRRATRESRRDSRERAQTTDDLLRIREIFEGTPRP